MARHRAAAVGIAESGVEGSKNHTVGIPCLSFLFPRLGCGVSWPLACLPAGPMRLITEHPWLSAWKRRRRGSASISFVHSMTVVPGDYLNG